MNPQNLDIVDWSADQRFRAFAENIGLDADDIWVGGYADYQWRNDRYFFEALAVAGKSILEFGANVGATAVVLARLGARVTAVDINPDYIELARLNAQRYGVAQHIQFLHISDTTQLPFAAESFDGVTIASVLHCVMCDQLPSVQREIDRVVKRGGVIQVTATSSRLWPREIHSQRWLVNYLPRAVDTLLRLPGSLQRGIFPWQVRRGFGDYVNLDLQDRGASYLAAKAKMEHSPVKLHCLRIANRVVTSLGLSIGLCAPCIAVALRKK